MPRILVVDDDQAIQSLLSDLLQGRGHSVIAAKTGREALAVIEESPPDLMILDVLIPHINGFNLLEQLRANAETQALPVIMISGIYRARNHRREMTQRLGVLEYLDKPFDIETLVGLVQDTVGGHAVADPPASNRETGTGKFVEPAAVEEKVEVEQSARNEFKQSAFLFQGSIKKTPVPEVIGELWAQQKSGALLLRQDRVKKIVYLRHGSPYHVKSNMVSECLGRLLVRERLISAEQCEASITEMKRSGRRQGEILVEMNSISPKNLKFALELQMETKLFEPFTWTGGEYRFNPTAKLPDLVQRIEWTGASFVVEGIRRAYDETRIRGQMLSVLQVPLQWSSAAPELKDLRLNSRERAAAGVITDGMSTEELLSAMAVHPPEALRIVYSLIALRMLQPQPA